MSTMSPTSQREDWLQCFYEAVLGNTQALVDRSGGKVVLLNGTAAVVWEGLRAGEDRGAIARRFAEHFAIPRKNALADVTAFADQLAALADDEKASAARKRIRIKAPEARDAARTNLSLGGRRIALVSAAPSLTIAVEALFSPLVGPKTRQRPHTTLEVRESRAAFVGGVDGKWCWRDADADMALGRLISDLTDAAYPQAQWGAVMHAGAVARGGRSIVLPGASGCGKSTLVAGLVHDGWSLLSDDIVPFDARTRKALPVPMAVAVKEKGRHVLLSRFPALETAPLHDFLNGPRRFMRMTPFVTEGCPVAAFVLPAYTPGATPCVDRVSPEEAFAALSSAKCWVSPDPEIGRAFFECVNAAPAFRATYPTLDAGVQLVGKMFDGLGK